MGHLTKIGILPDAQSTRLNPDLKMFKCELECDFRDAVVRPGMSCDVELVKETYAKATYCPIQCVVRIDDEAYVYVQDGSQWALRKVDVGLDNNRMIHILKGVKPGEVIMTAPPVQEEKDEDVKDGKDSNDRGSGRT
jgi:HlyD family secretion protein